MTDEYSNLVETPDGTTPLDPDELAGLRFKHVSTRSELDQLEHADELMPGLVNLSPRKLDKLLTACKNVKVSVSSLKAVS